MDFKATPIYIKYPVFQSVFIIAWLTVGPNLSFIVGARLIGFTYKIMKIILSNTFDIAYTMFELQGRNSSLAMPFFVAVPSVIFIIILIIGIELINYKLEKKKLKENYSNESDDYDLF